MPLEGHPDAGALEATARPRVLFVDDEQELLDGLRLLLHRLRRRWDVRFAVGGSAALALLAQEPFDIVVTDMRMPVMDGAELLDQVRRLHPSVTRLVLSGHCDDATGRRAARVAHQWLAKPCEPGQLVAALERARVTRELLCSDALKRHVAGITRLPAPDPLIVELTELLADATVDAGAVAELVSRDSALTARVLQLSNSAFFGPTQSIEDLHEAVMRLGLATLAELVVEGELVGRLEPPLAGFSLDEHAARARIVGRVAGALLRGRPEARAAALAGLLSTIGRLVLAHSALAEFASVAAAAAANAAPLTQLELGAFGVRQEVVGAALLASWGIPAHVTDLVLHSADPGPTQPTGLDALVALHLACGLTDEALGGLQGPALDRALLARLGLEAQVSAWQALAADCVAEERRRAQARRAA
ncbi:MAG: HDOD domain-containing protein [Planctomycetota bacterium]